MLLLVRLLTAAALLVTGGVHLAVADNYDGAGTQITVGMLFRAQGTAALLVAGWLLVQRRHLLPVLAAALVGLASTAAVVLSVYVRMPAIGPFPALYEPAWFPEKSLSALASGVAGVLALGLLGRSRAGKVT